VDGYEIGAQPLAAWQLSLQGGDNIQFNGPLLRSCMSAAIECAQESGCLTPDSVNLTEQCTETFRAHNAETDCAAQGFGLRVNPSDAIKGLPKKTQDKIRADWLP
jgi:hypothetical protein